MPNALYESVVSRLATQAPLIAKGLVQAAFARHRLDPETVTPHALRQVLDTDLLPKIARVVHGDTSFAGLGLGRIETDAAGRVRRIDPVLRALLPDLDPTPDAGLAARLRAADVLLPAAASDWDAAPVLVRTRHWRGRVQRLTQVRLADGGQLVLVQDVTLESELEREAVQLHDALRAAHARLTATQAQLVEQETLASLGRLVAGIAHEINTPIGIGVTAATHLAGEFERLRGEFAAGTLGRAGFAGFLTEAGEAVTLILGNLERAAALVRSFKMVAADQTSGESRAFALGDYLRDVLNSLGPRLRHTAIGVTLDCPPELVMQGRPGALAQVVTNFVTNALMHAFAPGASGQLRIQARRAADRVLLTLADDGRGMTDEERQSAFRPFFTTRRQAGGTGLGLSIMYQLVTGPMRGRIALHSAPGAGTRFDLDLPLALETPDPS